VGDRPDRYEPRVKKRRRNHYGWHTNVLAQASATAEGHPVADRPPAPPVRAGFNANEPIDLSVNGRRARPSRDIGGAAMDKKGSIASTTAP
jgi:hypothetical protein